MSGADRLVVAALGFMFAVIPLQGAFSVLGPLRPPVPPLVGVPGAIAIGVAMLVAAAICGWGALRRPPPRAIIVAQLAPAAAIALAAVLGFDPATGFALAIMVLGFGCVGIAVAGYGVLPGVARLLIASFLGASIASSLLALAMVISERPAALYAYHSGRAVGVFLNANECAAYLLIVLGIAGGTLLAVPRGALRRLAEAAGGIALITLGWTFSRSAFVAALCGLAAYAALRRDRRAALATVAGALLAAFIAFGLGGAHHNPRDDAARVVAWTTGVRTFVHFPLSGVGPLSYVRTYDVFRPPDAPGPRTPVAYDPHSLPLAFVDGSGVAGLCALIFGYAVYLRAIAGALRTAPARRRAVALAVGAGLLALNLHVLLNTISLYFALSAQTLALILALARVDLEPRAA